jgi:hypothetical protein
MRRKSLLLIALFTGAASPVAAQTEHGAFVMTLGKDTVAIDQYARTPRFLDGALLLRSPVTRVATYKARLREDGTIERLESRWWTPTPDAGPPQPPDAVATFLGDSVRIDYMRGSDTRQVMVAAGHGAVPLVNSVYSVVLYEQALRQGFAMDGRNFSAEWLALDRRGRVSSTPVAGRGQDSVSIGFFAGTMVARVDDIGHILGLHGRESTAKFTGERVADIDMELLAADFGARDAAGRGLGSMSPRDTVRGLVLGAMLEVDYSRPSKRDRVIWGGVVPWNTVWRTGANRATHFSTDADLVIEGVTVPAGNYTLFTWPTQEETQLIISKQTGQWGTVYREENDLARIAMRVEQLDQPVEQFTITIGDHDGVGMIALAWDERRYWVPVAVRKE